MLASGESAKQCIGKKAVTNKVTFARQAANEPCHPQTMVITVFLFKLTNDVFMTGKIFNKKHSGRKCRGY